MSDRHPWAKSTSACPDCGSTLLTMTCVDGSCGECLGDLAHYKCECGWSGDPFDLAEAAKQKGAGDE